MPSSSQSQVCYSKSWPTSPNHCQLTEPLQMILTSRLLYHLSGRIFFSSFAYCSDPPLVHPVLHPIVHFFYSRTLPIYYHSCQDLLLSSSHTLHTAKYSSLLIASERPEENTCLLGYLQTYYQFSNSRCRS